MARTIIFNAKQDSQIAEINILGVIGENFWSEGYTRDDAKRDIMDNKNKKLIVNIFSEGGSIADGLFIHDLLKMHGNSVANILGYAASAATIVALGANKIRMSENAQFMIHQPSITASVTPSNVDEIREDLNRWYDIALNIYQKRTGINDSELRAMMDKKDYWMNADEAVKLGFIDEKFTPMKVAATLRKSVEQGAYIEELLKNNNTDMEIQAKYDELTVTYNSLQNELETVKASYDAMQTVKATYEKQIEDITNELTSAHAEIGTLKAEISATKEQQILDYIENSVKAGKITEPLKEQYTILAKANFDAVKTILDTIPVRVTVAEILNSKIVEEAGFEELVKGKESWDAVDFKTGKNGAFDKTATRALLEKIEKSYPEQYNLIYMKAYNKEEYEKIKNKTK